MIERTVQFKQLGGISVDYFIGKSAKENFDIIDAALDHHMWFHIDGEPSCHVIAALPELMDRKDIKYIIKQGALLCKQHSKFKSNKRVEVVFTRIENVEKTDRIGTVIITSQKTISV
jgi:predicted ribosome quality control (RQC) complex YloA/Tae2 family protein